jgi:mono/diheme cytochrome c family protein
VAAGVSNLPAVNQQSQPTAAQPTSPPLPAGDAAKGQTLYTSSCSSCHGADAKGITGVGKDLTSGDFAATHDDAAFLAFIKTGRPSGDPANTTGIDMPPKGGNPALSDAQILDIIAYIRSIHE